MQRTTDVDSAHLKNKGVESHSCTPPHPLAHRHDLSLALLPGSCDPVVFAGETLNSSGQRMWELVSAAYEEL